MVYTNGLRAIYNINEIPPFCIAVYALTSDAISAYNDKNTVQKEEKPMLKRLFNGTSGSHMLPFLWLHGESHDALVREIEQVASCGIRAICLESRPHPDFVGPGWWADVDFILEECRRRDMRLYVLDDAAFPTGYAAGAVAKAPEHLRRQYLVCSTLKVIGPVKRHWCYRSLREDETLSFVVAVSEQGERLDLTKAIEGDRLLLDLGDSRYTLYFFVTTPHAMGERLDSYTNLLVKESVRILLDTVYEPHFARYKADFGGTFAGFFSDESAFMNTRRYDHILGTGGPLPWSVFFIDQFTHKLGKDAVAFLPDLFADIDGQSAQVRYTYMDLVSGLYRENMSRQVGDWCAAHGVEYIGHVIEDNNAHARLGFGTGHFFRAMDGQSMGGVDVVLHQLHPGLDSGFHEWTCNEPADDEMFTYCLAEMGASAAAIDEKKRGRAMCEIFGAYGWGEGNRLMKWMADFMLVRGINVFVPHAFSPKPGIDEDCPPHFYAHGQNPQFAGFRHLCRYMERLAGLLDGGERPGCAAVLYHGEGEWGGSCMLMQKPMAVLKRRQINADILPIETLASGRLEGGELRIGRGRYRALVIPYMEAAPAALLRQVRRLTGEGFPVIFVDDLPSRESCGEPFSPALLNNAQVLPLSELAARLDGLRTIRCSGTEPYLRVYWYRKENADIWMFFNEHPSHAIRTVVETSLPRPALQYDAMDDAWYLSDMGSGSAVLELAPQEARVFVFSDGLMDEVPAASSSCGGGSSALELADWDVSYRWAGSGEWTQKAPASLLEFSGSIRYRTVFHLPGQAEHAALNIENVGETVTGELNGQGLPVRLSWPYSWDISGAVCGGENVLTLEVATTLGGQRRDPLSAYMALPIPGLTGAVHVLYDEAKR